MERRKLFAAIGAGLALFDHRLMGSPVKSAASPDTTVPQIPYSDAPYWDGLRIAYEVQLEPFLCNLEIARRYWRLHRSLVEIDKLPESICAAYVDVLGACRSEHEEAGYGNLRALSHMIFSSGLRVGDTTASCHSPEQSASASHLCPAPATPA